MNSSTRRSLKRNLQKLPNSGRTKPSDSHTIIPNNPQLKFLGSITSPIKEYLTNLRMRMAASVRTRGVNFEGSVKLADDVLEADFVDFTQGGVYQFRVDATTLGREYTRYLVVKTLQELHEEMAVNGNMRIDE
jgi:hypothetical protein